MNLEVYFPFRWRQADILSWVAGRSQAKLTQLRTSVVDEVVIFKVEPKQKTIVAEELSFSTKAYFSDTLVCQFFATYNMPVPKTTSFWRMTDKVLGEIVGVPASRGLLSVTDGMLCFIVRSDGTYFKGHVGWFIPDDEEVDMDEVIAPKPTRKKFKAEEIDVLLTE